MKSILRIAVFTLAVFAVGILWLKIRPAKPAAPIPVSEQVSGVAPVSEVKISDASAPSTALVPPPPVPEPVAPETAVRAWTSKDGRQIQAEYISATTTAVTIKRSDGIVFTIPFTNLSGTDVAWIEQQPKSTQSPTLPSAATPAPPVAPRPQITQKQIDQIVTRFPTAPALNGYEVTNDLKELHLKYLGMVKFIRPNTITPNLQMIRSKIDDDIKRLNPIAGTASGDWTGKRNSSQSAAAENTILSARRSLTWLQGPLTTHLQAYENIVATE
jgi:hypothetical protein